MFKKELDILLFKSINLLCFVFNKLNVIYKIPLDLLAEARLSLVSTSVEVGRIAPDEERLALSKPVVQFSFPYGMSRGIL